MVSSRLLQGSSLFPIILSWFLTVPSLFPHGSLTLPSWFLTVLSLVPHGSSLFPHVFSLFTHCSLMVLHWSLTVPSWFLTVPSWFPHCSLTMRFNFLSSASYFVFDFFCFVFLFPLCFPSEPPSTFLLRHKEELLRASSEEINTFSGNLILLCFLPSPSSTLLPPLYPPLNIK